MEAKEIKEMAEEVADRKSESPLKVSEENDPFTRFGDRDEFLPGSVANDLGETRQVLMSQSKSA